MKIRIAVWALAGAIVVLAWSLCFMTIAPGRLAELWGLVYLTIPVSLVRYQSHPGSLYTVMVINAATYALAGLAFEAVRRRVRPVPAPGLPAA
jgi:hypothetical protein